MAMRRARPAGGHQPFARPPDAPASLSLAPFVSKLYDIISSASPSDCIKWGPAGDTIIVTDQAAFAREVLPRFFKHENIRSFVRQLNMYGFQRCRNPGGSGSVEGEHSQRGSVEGEYGQLEFYHENFIEGRKDLMCQITRGVPSHKRQVVGVESCASSAVTLVGANGAGPSAQVILSAQGRELSQEMSSLEQLIAETDVLQRMQLGTLQNMMSGLVDAFGHFAAQGAPPPGSPADVAAAAMGAHAHAPSVDPTVRMAGF
jgi:hypothetical protein